MRLDKVYIDGFKNLKQLEVDFDETKLTTVLIGQNGAGKSNPIEAITQVFRWIDLRKHEPAFSIGWTTESAAPRSPCLTSLKASPPSRWTSKGGEAAPS